MLARNSIVACLNKIYNIGGRHLFQVQIFGELGLSLRYWTSHVEGEKGIVDMY